MLALDLSISDSNKPLLLASEEGFVAYLVDGLLLDEGHPRAVLPAEKKAWLQRIHCESLAQLALFPAGRAALLEPLGGSSGGGGGGSVSSALEVVAAEGLSAEASACARTALEALAIGMDGNRVPSAHHDSVTVAGINAEAASRHVMISYCWDQQTVIKRVHTALIKRGYNVWIE